MTTNEVGFVKNMMNIDNYIASIQENVKNLYDVDTKYDSDDNTLFLNESNEAKLSLAKNYILSKIDENLISIK